MRRTPGWSTATRPTWTPPTSTPECSTATSSVSFLARRGEKVTIDAEGKPNLTGRLGDDEDLKTHLKPGEWNQLHVIAKGRRLVHKINGQTMIEVDVQGEKLFRQDGLIAVQLHPGPPMKIELRNIRLK